MAQTILNFSIESSDEKLTPRLGTILLGESYKAIRLKRCVIDTYQNQKAITHINHLDDTTTFAYAS